MSKVMALWFEGPLQSWGYNSRFDVRKTLDFPTRSGIFGMLLAASGDSGPQEELLKQMETIRLDVFGFDDASYVLSDFHMVGNGFNSDDEWQKLMSPRKIDGSVPVGGGAKLTRRSYLQDRCFVAFLTLSDELAEKFSHALHNPVYELYLGRKCCVPAAFVFVGCYDTAAEAVASIKTHLLQKNEQRPDNPLAVAFHVYEVDSLQEYPDAFALTDVPLRFGLHKLYGERIVVKTSCTEISL